MTVEAKNQRQTRRKFLSTLLGSASVVAGFPLILTSRWGFGVPKRRSLPKLYKMQRKLLGTWVSMMAFSHDETTALSAMDDAFGAMKQVDDLMTIHRSSSQISKINQKAGNDAVKVDRRVLEVVQRAVFYSQQTAGAYDVTILPLMKLFGFYGAAPKKVPSDKSIARTLESVGWSHIRVDSNRHTIGLTKKGASIDLGSIGKGYAVQQAVDVLRRKKIKSALIDGGGNVCTLGAPHDDPDPRTGWRVAIRNPKGSGRTFFETLVLRDRAVATSGVDQNFVTIGSKEIGHIFNGRTGHPCSGLVSCSVVARNATDADALSTTGFILGQSKTQSQFGHPSRQFFFHV